MSIREGTVDDIMLPAHYRAGVIPYTFIDGKVYWLMGINQHYMWSDFGGGCKKVETTYSCLMRELYEESNGLLNDVVERAIDNRNGVKVYIAYDRKGNLNDYLLLVPIPYCDYEFTPNRELRSLHWIPESAILNPFTPLRLLHSALMRFVQYMREQID